MPGIVQSEHKISIDQRLVKKVFIESLDQLLLSRSLEGSKIKKIFLLKVGNIKKVQQNYLSLIKA